MRKTIIVIVLLTLSISVAHAVQVDGYCYLENQNNHSGTKVLFQADSPSAITDSVFSDATGYYQIDVSLGGYDVKFSHDLYYDDELLDQLFFTNTTLPDIILMQMPAGIHLSGPLSGTLMDTTYLVIGDISVQNGDSLVSV